MPFLRTLTRSRAHPHPVIPLRTPLLTAPFSTHHRLLAHSSYGGGDGSPVGENPQQQGAQKSSDLEHPGPPPPDVGKGTGGGPTKATGKGHEGPGEGDGKKKSAGGSPMGNPSERVEKPEEVERHNREFERRHDRSANKGGDEEKVDKKFWKGQGGADRQP